MTTARGTDSAKVVQVIKTKALRGKGTQEDLSRIVTQYWDFDGNLLAEHDPSRDEFVVTGSDMKFDISETSTKIDAEKPKKLKKFDVLKSITDVQKFSDMVFDLVADAKTPDKLSNLLSEEFTEKGLQSLKSIARHGYPLSLDLKQ